MRFGGALLGALLGAMHFAWAFPGGKGCILADRF